MSIESITHCVICGLNTDKKFADANGGKCLPCNNKEHRTKNFDEAIAEYCAKLTKCYAAHLGAEHPTLKYCDLSHEPNDGKVYVRINRVEKRKETGEVISGSAVSFVKRADGTIWKPASWKAPAKNFPRGNVFELGEFVPWAI